MLNDLARHRLVPVIMLDDPDVAGPLGDALVEGGLPVAEVTLRTDNAIEATRRLAARGDLLVGAGTVMDARQVAAVADAGARFVVSPGLYPDVLDACAERGLPYLPGVATATEIGMAVKRGLSLLKFFPAGTLGGPAALGALAGVFPTTRFMPTGGVTAENARDYLAHPQVACCGGSWLVRRDRVDAGDWETIRATVADAVASVG